MILLLLPCAGCASGQLRMDNGPDQDLTLSGAAQQMPLAGQGTAVPAGVDPAVWRQLQSALEQSMAAASRSTAKAPTGSQNMVADLSLEPGGSSSAVLSWSYRNVGDYDLNSQVNISDLTAIGLHFGKSDSSPDWEIAQLADGDGNCLITIADVTPIGANFGNVVSGYSIRRSATGSAFSEIGKVSQAAGVKQSGLAGLSFSYQAEGLQLGDLIHVVAMDNADGSEGVPSNEVLFTSSLRPQNLLASQGEFPGEVRLDWDPVENAGAYRVERRHVTMTVYELLAETGGEETEYVDLDVLPGQPRTYRVAAIIDGIPGAFSDSATGFSMPLPDAPLNPAATNGTVASAIEISWEQVAAASVYRVYRDGAGSPIAETTEAFHLDEDDPLPGDHSYVITAINAAGESGPSISVTGSAGIIPQAPESVSASDATDAVAIQLSWSKSDYATGYRLYRDDASNLIATLGDVDSYSDDQVTDHDEHPYWVSAFTALGESPKTGPDAGSRKLLPPAAPTGVEASQGTERGSVRISWDPDPAAQQFFIYRDGNPLEIAVVGQVGQYYDNAVPDLAGTATASGQRTRQAPDRSALPSVALPTIAVNGGVSGWTTLPARRHR